MMFGMSGWKRVRSIVVTVAVVGAVAAIGAAIAERISGVTALGLLIGAAPLAGSGAVAPLAADWLGRRAESRRVFESVADRRQPVAAGAAPRVANLLDPREGVVPFTGRKEERARLREWCTGDHLRRVRLLTGGGGVGKTRLALWLDQELELLGWQRVWVVPGREDGAVAAVRGRTQGRVLLIIDYADTRLGLEKLLVATAADTGRALRVLLLARQAGDWWQRLSAGSQAARAMTAEAAAFSEQLAPDISHDLTDIEVVRQAMPYFAARLGIEAPDPARVVLTRAGRSARVLDLHAAALIAVLTAHEHTDLAMVQVDVAAVLGELLGHERSYWRGQAEALDLLGGPQGLSIAQLGQIVWQRGACLAL